MTQGDRKTVPKDVVARVLIRSRRRCCLCAFWDKDCSQKDGQIAHVDRDPSNAAEDNLVYLCFPHHNQYDAKQLQGKNISPKELRHARDELYRQVNPDSEALFSVTLTLNREFDSFTDEDQQNFLTFVQDVLEKHGNLEVTQKTPGSVNLTIELSERETERLFTAVEAGTFRPYGLSDARIVHVKIPPPAVEFWETYLGGISPHVLAEQTVLDIIATPHRAQHFFQGRSTALENSRCSLFVKTFGHASDQYTALVVSSFLHSHMVVGFAARLYPSDVPHSSDWEPLDILRAFLKRYGIDETYTGLGSKRLFQAVPLPLPLFVHNGPLAIAYLHSLRRHPAKQDPRQIEFINLHFYEPENHRVFIELAFGFSLRRYVRDLHRHGVNLPSSFKKKALRKLK